MNIEKTFENIKKPTYILLAGTFYVLYIIAFLGIAYVNPKYIENVSFTLQLFVSMFLLYKFHPFREHKLEQFDGTLIFASAILLFTNTGMTHYVVSIGERQVLSKMKGAQSFGSGQSANPGSLI